MGRFRLSPEDADVVRRALATAKGDLASDAPTCGDAHERTNAAALVAMARSYLADPQTGPGPQPEIVVHLGLAALRSDVDAVDPHPECVAADVSAETSGHVHCDCATHAGRDGADPADVRCAPMDPVLALASSVWPVHTSTGAALSLAVFARLACDAGLRQVIDLPDGSKLDLGRRRRLPDAALRRALLARDVHCRFPGCSTRHSLVAHHIVWWSLGGRTDLANLLLLCPKHHHAVHDREWLCTGTGAAPVFARPDGRRADPSPPSVSGSLGDLLSAHEACGLDVAVEHPGGRWQGDQIDWDCFFAAFAAPERPRDESHRLAPSG